MYIGRSKSITKGTCGDVNFDSGCCCSANATRDGQSRAGVPAQYVDIPAEAQRKAMLDQGMPEWQATALLDLQDYYTAGKCGTVNGLLQKLLGRSPNSMDQFLQEFAGEFRAQAAKA